MDHISSSEEIEIIVKAKKRFTLELSPQIDDLLVKWSEESGMTRAELLRRAIALMEASRNAAHEGLKVGFVDSKGTLKREVVGF